MGVTGVLVHAGPSVKVHVLAGLDQAARLLDQELDSTVSTDQGLLLRLRVRRDRAYARAAGYRDDDRVLTAPGDFTFPLDSVSGSLRRELARQRPGPFLFREGINSTGIAPGPNGGTQITLRWGLGVRSAGRERPFAFHAVCRAADAVVQECRPFSRPIDRVNNTRASAPPNDRDRLAAVGKVVLPPLAGGLGRLAGVPFASVGGRVVADAMVRPQRRMTPFTAVLSVEPGATSLDLPRDQRVDVDVVRPQLAALEHEDPRGVAEIRKAENEVFMSTGAMTAVQAARLDRRIDRCFPGSGVLPATRDDRASRNLLLGAFGAGQWRADRLVEDGA